MCYPTIFRHDVDSPPRPHWLWRRPCGRAGRPANYFPLLSWRAKSVIVLRGYDGAAARLLQFAPSALASCSDRAGNAQISWSGPYHTVTYGWTARCVRPPYGAEFDAGALGLAGRLASSNGLVFVSLAETVRSARQCRDGDAALLFPSFGPYGWAEARVAHRRRALTLSRQTGNWRRELSRCYTAPLRLRNIHAFTRSSSRPRAPPRSNARDDRAQRGARHRRSASTVIGHQLKREEAVLRLPLMRLYDDGVATGSADGKAVAPLMGAFRDYERRATLGQSRFLRLPALAYPDPAVIYYPLSKSPGRRRLARLRSSSGRSDAREGDRLRTSRSLTWLWKSHH